MTERPGAQPAWEIVAAGHIKWWILQRAVSEDLVMVKTIINILNLWDHLQMVFAKPQENIYCVHKLHFSDFNTFSSLWWLHFSFYLRSNWNEWIVEANVGWNREKNGRYLSSLQTTIETDRKRNLNTWNGCVRVFCSVGIQFKDNCKELKIYDSSFFPFLLKILLKLFLDLYFCLETSLT